MRYNQLTQQQKDRLWYPPVIGTVFRSTDTVYWLANHLRQIQETLTWPPEPSNYVDPGIHLPLSSQRAAFVTPVELLLEFEARCAACGRDGTMTVVRYRDGMAEDELARLVKLEEYTVRRKIGDVISYAASGECRRWIATKKREGTNYKEWCER